MAVQEKPISLLILAAGAASRYGKAKQIEGFGPSNETLMEYSIYDAIKAGFNKVVFVIREKHLVAFREIIDAKLKGKIEVEYAFQADDLSSYGIQEVVERKKPWGTAHAILSAEDKIQEPFCMINADDFYGADSFKKMANFLRNEVTDSEYSLVAYLLEKTLSETGSVSRGVCQVNSQGYLDDICERLKIAPRENGEISNEEEDGSFTPIPKGTAVSMNFFGFHVSLFKFLRAKLPAFFEANKDNPKSEFLIPSVVQELMHDGAIKMRTLTADSKWFGVTYPEDADNVEKSLKELVNAKQYPNNLWA